MNKRTIILLGVLALAVLLKLSFWADQRSFEVQGVTRMVPGPGDTLYLLTNEEILQVSRGGDVLAHWTFERLGITEPVADLAMGLEGQLLIGLIESQEIRRYAGDGAFTGVIRRLPSPERVGVPGQHLRNFKFARDDRSGTLYVADSNHHRIQIYRSEGGAPLVLTSPSGSVRMDAEETAEAEGGEGADQAPPPAQDPDRPFLYPNALAIDGDRLYATDTDNHRIVVLHLDGTLDRIIPTTKGVRSPNVFPVHFSRMDDQLFVINRSPLFAEGEVVIIDLASLRIRRLYPESVALDPLDLLVVGDDVLITDGETRNILRYSPGGYYLGFFGSPALQEILQRKADVHRNYLVLRVLAIGGMAVVLIGFLVLKRVERVEQAAAGLPDAHQQIEGMQNLLGPAGSVRRRLLLVLVPGFGQVAAGRILRAIILVPPLVFLVLLFLFAIIMAPGQGMIHLFTLLFIGMITAAYWAGVVLDGIRLNEPAGGAARRFGLYDVLRTAGYTMITAAAAAASQLAWEYLKRSFPEVPLAMQGMVGRIMLGGGLSSADMIPFHAASVAGRLVGWGGAVAGMFGALAWRLGQERARIARAAAVGLFVGLLSWLLCDAVPGSMLGGAFLLPLSLGLVIGMAVYLQFRGPLVTVLVLPLAIAAAWTGSMIHLMLFPFVNLPFLPPGVSVRTVSIIVEACSLHLAVLLLMRRREARAGAAGGA